MVVPDVVASEAAVTSSEAMAEPTMAAAMTVAVPSPVVLRQGRLRQHRRAKAHEQTHDHPGSFVHDDLRSKSFRSFAANQRSTCRKAPEGGLAGRRLHALTSVWIAPCFDRTGSVAR